MKRPLFQVAMYLNVAAALFFLAVTAYLGTFTRYMADDYCESNIAKDYSPIGAVFNRYEAGDWRAANRFSNLLFAGTMEQFGPRNIEVVPAVMMILWAIGLIVLVRQAAKFSGINWDLKADVFFGMMIAALAVLQAPNPYQTFYWRSSMSTHFVPLVFFNFFLAYLLDRALKIRSCQALPFWELLFVVLTSFMIGGFSEPPVTIMVTSGILSITAVQLFISDRTVRRRLTFLAGGFLLGALAALAVMAVSPAAKHVGESAPGVLEVARRTVEYTYLYIIDVFRTIPLPVIYTFMIAGMFSFLLFNDSGEVKIPARVIVTPVLVTVLFIAASFSASAYGQSFPVERARFVAHYLIVITLVFEGILLGRWLTQFIKNPVFVNLGVAVFLIASVYLFRAGAQAAAKIPQYQHREDQWDKRDRYIRELAAGGERNLIVPQFDGVDGVKELDTYGTHWVNYCAARFYGVDRIETRYFPLDFLDEYYAP